MRREICVGVQFWFGIDGMSKKEAIKWCEKEAKSLMVHTQDGPEVIKKIIGPGIQMSAKRLQEK